jgi:two-component system, OmpR family, osmolarity sensor histidine kinase EnvZ
MNKKNNTKYVPRLRVLLILLTAVAALHFSLSALFFWRSNTVTDQEFRFPLPNRIAHMVMAVETVPSNQREILLNAFRSEDIDLWIENRPFENDEDVESYNLPQVEDIVDSYLQELGSREVMAWIAIDPNEALQPPRMERLRLWTKHPMKLAISLKDGDWLIIQTQDNLPERVYGIPPGLLSALLGLIVAAFSLVMLWRGLGPLEKLSKRLEAFSVNPKPVELNLSGPRETRQITAAINQMQVDIAKLIQDRESMLAGMSHDLRTYLTRLRLRIDQLPDQQSRDKAERDIDEMGAIVDDALTFARLGISSLHIQSVNAQAFVADVGKSWAEQLDIHIESSSAGANIQCDPSLMRRAIVNLLANAERHAKDTQLTLRLKNDQVEIDVADRGPGIPDAEKPRVRHSFQRGDTARTLDRPGSGLGLSIAIRIIEQHGGTLDLLDREGGGLIARIRLPRAN